MAIKLVLKKNTFGWADDVIYFYFISFNETVLI